MAFAATALGLLGLFLGRARAQTCQCYPPPPPPPSTLLFSHCVNSSAASQFFGSPAEALRASGDPSAAVHKYSQLWNLGRFLYRNKVSFQLVYPGLPSIVWSQASDPTAEKYVSGLSAAPHGWKGLLLGTSASFITSSNNTHIGAYGATGGGISGPAGPVSCVRLFATDVLPDPPSAQEKGAGESYGRGPPPMGWRTYGAYQGGDYYKVIDDSKFASLAAHSGVMPITSGMLTTYADILPNRSLFGTGVSLADLGYTDVAVDGMYEACRSPTGRSARDPYLFHFPNRTIMFRLDYFPNPAATVAYIHSKNMTAVVPAQLPLSVLRARRRRRGHREPAVRVHVERGGAGAERVREQLHQLHGGRVLPDGERGVRQPQNRRLRVHAHA